MLPLCDTKKLTKDAFFLDNEKLVFYLQAPDIKIKISERLNDPDIAPELRSRLEDLDNRIEEDSNPVLFICHLKDKL